MTRAGAGIRPEDRDELHRSVVISTGFHRTHMTVAAREADRLELLQFAAAGAYPTARARCAFTRTGIDRLRRVRRLAERHEEIDEQRLHPHWLPEVGEETARAVARLPGLHGTGEIFSAGAMRLYGSAVARQLKHATPAPRVFHFRAGFGHASIAAARRRGAITLCDHAAVHPAVWESLVAHGGSLDRAVAFAQEPEHPLWRAMLGDLRAADALLVNSQFVRDMFVRLGWPAERIHVVYLGVDAAFHREALRPRRPRESALRLLFAGRFEAAKGAEVLLEALAELGDIEWQLVIAGPIDRELARHHRARLADRRVVGLGTVDRARLAQELRAAPVFVFPSLAEGSARVVFEALACGSYVITTPNAGSIVESGVHGELVPAGESAALAQAIRRAAIDVEGVDSIGHANATLIRARYGQHHYGEALARVYSELVATTKP